MNIKEFADMLNGREYGIEITKQEEELADDLGFVVVFGYSDDNMEFRSVWHDTGDYEWIYLTDIPHETFDIMFEGEKYCRGIVFELKEAYI